MIPKKSYIIWFTPRTGSTLLCKSLEDTAMAGKPGEFFNMDEGQNFSSHYDLSTYQDLRNRLWSLGCSHNGVMAMKYSLYRLNYDRLSAEVASLRDLKSLNHLDWNLWSDLFPNCRHIFLTRRNKIRLAVSWWKAIQDNQWHLIKGEGSKKSRDFYHDKYNFDALLHLLKDHCLRECALQEFFTHNGILPMTVVYEDFITNYRGTISSVLLFIEEDPAVQNEEMYFSKTSDEISEFWVERFRTELQQDWDRPIW